ncbi:hypothetical protein FS837_008770 [Tulasnella sp. UAMH 9824]|nr:hypothetical protein FS837_008770 [Tulasnella sp. UAMH 9824]
MWRKFRSLWTWRRFFAFIFLVILTVPLGVLLGSTHNKWVHISDPYPYAANQTDPSPVDGARALVSVKPDEGKMYIEWRVGGIGNYSRPDYNSSLLCSLYNAMPGLNGLDAMIRHHVVFFDGQPVFNSSTVADPSSGTILPCGDYTTGGRQFIFGHPLDVGLDYRAQRAEPASYPYEKWTTSSRICAWGPEKKEHPPIAFTAVLVSRVDGFLIRSNFSRITSITDLYGYVLTLTLERDPLARFFAHSLFAITWIVAILAVIFAVLSPLWAYPKPKAPPLALINISTPSTLAANGAWTGGNTIYEGFLEHGVPEREAPKTSEALWPTVTIGGILIVIRSQYPGNPPLGTYLDYFGFCKSLFLSA